MALRSAPLRFAPAFRALGVCELIWPFSLRDIWATLLSPKWAELFVAQMVGDETSLPLRLYCWTLPGGKFFPVTRYHLYIAVITFHFDTGWGSSTW